MTQPKFAETWCSQCGSGFGPGDHGYSHCSDHRSRRDNLAVMLEEMSDDQGRIYYTSNTGKLLDEATEFGLVRPVYGEFRAIEPGCLNSLYRLTRMN